MTLIMNGDDNNNAKCGGGTDKNAAAYKSVLSGEECQYKFKYF